MMALPLAHGLLGATVAVLLMPAQPAKLELKTILAGAVVAISPDLDYVFYRVLGLGESWHRGFSHSVIFALVAGLMATILVGPLRLRFFLIYSLATFSHPILDALTTEDIGGVQLFWPLSDEMFRFGLVNYRDVFSGDPTSLEILLRILRISLIECLVFFPILMAVVYGRRLVRARLE